MTLRLVDNVEDLPVVNVHDFVAMTDALADDFETKRFGIVSRVIVLIENDEGISLQWWGAAADKHKLAGMMREAELCVFADDIIED